MLRWAADGCPIMLNFDIKYKGCFRFPPGAYIDDSRAIQVTEEPQRNGCPVRSTPRIVGNGSRV